MENFPAIYSDNNLEIKLTTGNELALLPDTRFDYEDMKVQFDPQVPFYEKTDYLVAAACGSLTALLDGFLVKNISLEQAHEWGNKEVNEFVIKAARTQGYKGDDINAAVSFLEKKFPFAGDKVMGSFGGATQHHIRDFSHHPTIVGLVFSILTQFTGRVYGTDVTGVFVCVPVPDELFLGKTFPEKILFGTVRWMFHLISDIAGSSGSIGNRSGGTGIPGPLLSFFKEVSALPFFKSIKDENDINLFSKWLSKLFNGTATGTRIDFRTELGLLFQQIKHSLPVVANELIVRGYYMVSRICVEISDKNIKSIKQLNLIDVDRIIPIKKRRLYRMLTISSGSFFAITTSVTVAKGIASEQYATIFINLNYVGIARFAFALKDDYQYIKEDSQALFEEIKKRNLARDQFFAKQNIGVSYFVLSEQQGRLLDSLKNQKVEYDISKTDEKKSEIKKLWQKQWLGITNEINSYKLIMDEPRLYLDIRDEVKKSGDKFWLYIAAMELAGFKPYYVLGENEDDDKQFKSLRLQTDYMYDCFTILQGIVDRDEYKKIMDLRWKYENYLNETSKKVITGVASTLVVTAVSGGVAWAAAPTIAVALAGGSYAGLYGAALTNASLAAIGGGSLAAGGLGMSGGTAIITGGGALLSMLGSSGASATAMKFLSSKGNVITECINILTYCELVRTEKEDSKEILQNIKDYLESSKEECEANIAHMKSINSKEKDNKLIRASENNLKYIGMTITEIEKSIEGCEVN